MRGFPIRTSWPHRLVINSTRLIADSHVLHRLLLPRHPPCALSNLPHYQPHGLTVTKSSANTTPPHTPQGRGNDAVTQIHHHKPHTTPNDAACEHMNSKMLDRK